MLNNYPIYIVSKGRYEITPTADSLDNMGTSYYVVVEEQEYEKYLTRFKKEQLLILPIKYKEEYDTFDEFGLTKSTGPGPARNFAWAHSIKNGFKRHWVMDDNILHFYRFYENFRYRCDSPSILRAAEDFVDRYENVYISGLQYTMFAIPGKIEPPFLLNTRIYSCLLIMNDIPYRWRGRYNEDTDLSLRVLKDGHCTMEFIAFLQGKLPTQVLRGGNSKEFYDDEGTYAKSKMIEDMHPDVARVQYKFGRIHHQVNYNKFKNNRLIKKDFTDYPHVDNYGMKLIEAK